MHDLPLLINITLALVVAFIGGLIARRIGLPTIIGYLAAGIAIGPFTPGFTGDVETISQLAELGVIFLMFGVGLHFSFKDLLRVREIAIPGALVQTAAATLLGIALTRAWGWPVSSGLILGLAVSVASTVVLLRGLIDHSLLNTAHGQAAVGWLVMEDIFSVLILVFMPALVQNTGGVDWGSLAVTLAKAAAFVAIMFLAGARLIPWVLERIAHTRSRELFVLAILAIALGTAMGASEWFGVSLALGAFMAGAIISQSHLGHQVGADVFAFREAFSVLFFVSVGMLVNPIFLWENLGQIAALAGLIVIGKAAIVIVMGLFFPQPMRTFLVVAVGLSQVGEFSFILGQAGAALGLLDADQYALILAAALISITVNPFMYRLLPRLERLLLRLPGRKERPAGSIPDLLQAEGLRDHVVVVGFGRVGEHIVEVLETLGIPQLVIEADVARVEALNRRGTLTLYGDAANSELITHAGLEHARALVITVPDEAAAEVIVTAARSQVSSLPVIARAATETGVRRLVKSGAQDVIHPELEGGLEIVRHTLLRLGFAPEEINRYTDSVRQDHYDLQINTEEEHHLLRQLLQAAGAIELTWLQLKPGSQVVGRTLAEANLRARTGASVVAILRGRNLLANPESRTIIEAGDRIGFIGDRTQIEALEHLLSEGGL